MSYIVKMFGICDLIVAIILLSVPFPQPFGLVKIILLMKLFYTGLVSLMGDNNG